MAKRQDIDQILRSWPYEPGEVSARLVRAGDGREVLQMRVEMGILQLEVEGRPDGQRPGGRETYFDHLLHLALHEGQQFELNSEQCTAADREFLQFYHRRICWLALREFRRAVRDADHSLAFMDFVRAHSSDEQWILSHEQYRPYVLFHRTQAAVLAKLEEVGAEAALAELNAGLNKFRELFAEYEAEEQFEDDEMVQRLVELKDALRNQYHLKSTLEERLADAVASEQYELAAWLRDEMSRRRPQKGA
ncbi:MAG TPA: DNA helicase UvrBC [Pirellulales bacterium]|nr:DNA helicase UvrBC [Pirellulales bacterium]